MLALTEQAERLGLVRVGATEATPFAEAGSVFRAWLDKGYAGDMSYLEELGDRSDPRRLLPNARTVLVVAMPTTGMARGEPTAGCGEIADYALGLDYHIALRGRLQRLCQAMANLAKVSVWARPCVDTAPLLEREAARRAGIGFIAKSNMLIVPGLGPRVLLGAVVTDLELPSGTPMESRCGRCTRCLEACPTQAFVGPYELDARRCLSYLTIEHQGDSPRELREMQGTRLVGCDVCQTVCPFDRIENARVMPSDSSPRAHLLRADLRSWLRMSATDYRRITKRTALRRLGRVQLMRNAAIALGNTRDPAAVPALAEALVSNKSPIVRAHAAWALGRIGNPEARSALKRGLEVEGDDWVREEANAALG